MELSATNDEKKDDKYRTFDEYRKRFYQGKVEKEPETQDKDGSASFGRDLARELVKRK